jgi:8-oxo-dGTP pyrophosphatase MutT (NUDIX family)
MQYKIFIRDCELLITDTAPVSAALQVDTANASGNIVSIVLDLNKSSGNTSFFMLAPEPKKILETIQDALILVKAAGGLVWNTFGSLLMIFRRGKWDLPKGKVESDESLETAAIREVEEESGIGKLRLLRKFDITFHIYAESDRWIIKETHWYEMLSHDTGLAVPQQSEGITMAGWVELSQIADKLNNTYASISHLISKALLEGYPIAR